MICEVLTSNAVALLNTSLRSDKLMAEVGRLVRSRALAETAVNVGNVLTETAVTNPAISESILVCKIAMDSAELMYESVAALVVSDAAIDETVPESVKSPTDA